MTKREWQIEMANRFAKRDNVKELTDAQNIIRDLKAKLECYERLADASEMASNPMGVKSRVMLKNVGEMKTIMTQDEEILLRELAGGRCTIQKVTDAIGPMSLWSKDGLEAEIRRAVEAELEHEIKRMREEMKIKSVTMRCKDYDVALPIIYNDFGRVLVGQVSIPPQRTWAGLTDKEMLRLYNEHIAAVGLIGVFRAIEAKLKEKNT